MTKALIIARYRESYKWLDDPRLKNFDVIMYNKGRGNKGIKLENVGREAHAYLHHIIENYDNLHDINVFCQGSPFDHFKTDQEFWSCIQHIDESNETDYFDFNLLNTRVRIEKHAITRAGAKVFNWIDPRYVIDLLDTIGDTTHKQYRKNNLPTILDVSHYAIFSAGKETILSHPIDVYKALLRHTIDEPNGAYTLEILWRTLFA